MKIFREFFIKKMLPKVIKEVALKVRLTKTLLPFLSLMVLVVGVQPLYAASVEDAMNRQGRLERDLERDNRSHPEAVIPMLGLEEGDTVADIFGGGGYYSELLSVVVGSEGRVLLHNNSAYLQFAGPEIKQRFDGRSFANISRHNHEAEDLNLGVEQLDAAMIIMSYHDLYHVAEGWPQIDGEHFIRQILHSLKPGGRFLIVDHVAAIGTGKTSAQDLHRIEPEFARKDIENMGFRYLDSNSALRNTTDDYTLTVFDPTVQGKTDRFIMVFEKPAS